MIVVKLWGGLCNQMFQYAFGYQFAKKVRDKVAFDVDFYKNQPKYVSSRKLEVCDSFCLSTFDTIDRPRDVKPFQNRYISFITRKMNFLHVKLLDGTFYIKEKEHTYTNKIPYKPSCLNYYDGYWQTEEYFNWISHDIRSEFAFSEEVRQRVQNWLLEYKGNTLVSIHIRRGDLAGKNYGYSDKAMIDYYHRAMTIMKERVPDPLFVVFSDDPAWCKTEMKWNTTRIIYSENPWGAIHDLCGISLCDHGIMSQSTFSWWGNWLGNPEERIVLSPKGKSFNNKFIPDRWSEI